MCRGAKSHRWVFLALLIAGCGIQQDGQSDSSLAYYGANSRLAEVRFETFVDIPIERRSVSRDWGTLSKLR
jgi:hypothetical protein